MNGYQRNDDVGFNATQFERDQFIETFDALGAVTQARIAAMIKNGIPAIHGKTIAAHALLRLAVMTAADCALNDCNRPPEIKRWIEAAIDEAKIGIASYMREKTT